LGVEGGGQEPVHVLAPDGGLELLDFVAMVMPPRK